MKMRIVAGNLGGQFFDATRGHKTHPMSEKIRGALFNMLGDIEGLSLLDAFAGTAAVSLEAASRGARNIIAIDADTHAHDVISQNILRLQLQDTIKAIRANNGSWSDNNQDMQFDLVICDPPYDQVKASQLTKMATHTKPNGLFVMSLPPNTEVALPKAFKKLAQKKYGDATLVFYRKTG